MKAGGCDYAGPSQYSFVVILLRLLSRFPWHHPKTEAALCEKFLNDAGLSASSKITEINSLLKQPAMA